MTTSQPTANSALLPGVLAKPVARQLSGDADVWSMTLELRELGEADSGMLNDLLSLFLSDSALRLHALTSACAQKDFKIARSQAHSLRGSALQIGATGLASRCAALELSDGSEPERCGVTIGAMLSAIDDEFVLVRGAIREYLVNIEKGP